MPPPPAAPVRLRPRRAGRITGCGVSMPAARRNAARAPQTNGGRSAAKSGSRGPQSSSSPRSYRGGGSAVHALTAGPLLHAGAPQLPSLVGPDGPPGGPVGHPPALAARSSATTQGMPACDGSASASVISPMPPAAVSLPPVLRLRWLPHALQQGAGVVGCLRCGQLGSLCRQSCRDAPHRLVRTTPLARAYPCTVPTPPSSRRSLSGARAAS